MSFEREEGARFEFSEINATLTTVRRAELSGRCQHFSFFSDYELVGRVRAFARDCGRKIRMGMVCIVQTSTRNDSAVVHPKQNSLTANFITLNDSFFVNNIDV